MRLKETFRLKCTELVWSESTSNVTMLKMKYSNLSTDVEGGEASLGAAVESLLQENGCGSDGGSSQQCFSPSNSPHRWGAKVTKELLWARQTGWLTTRPTRASELSVKAPQLVESETVAKERMALPRQKRMAV